MTINVASILLVEDNPNDVQLVLQALSEFRLNNEVVVARDGEEALDYLFLRRKFQSRPPGNPVLILLDLKMPKVDGLEVLHQMRKEPSVKNVPVVMLTSSQEEPDLARAYELGANAYVVKPVEFDQFVKAVRQIELFWAVVNEPPPGSCKKPTHSI